MLKRYFRIYTLAVTEALRHSDNCERHEILDPSYFVSEQEAKFLDDNYKLAYTHEALFFDNVAIYLDAVDHGFTKTDRWTHTSELRNQLEMQIQRISRKYS